MDVPEQACWPSRCPRRDSTLGRSDGGRESHVGLHADPRSPQETWASCWPLDDHPDSQEARTAAGAGAADLVADVSSRALGRGGRADFFTTEVWTWRGLVTFYTVFVIDLASRRVQIVGSTPHPNEHFMRQVGRTLTATDGLLSDHRVLICDRDRKWSRFRRPMRTPMPNDLCGRSTTSASIGSCRSGSCDPQIFHSV